MKEFNFDNSYSTLSNKIYTKQSPDKPKNPKVVIFNNELAKEIGIEIENPKEILSGRGIPTGAEPIAQAYAGHQYGYLNILGDGRAILLGEHITPDNKRYDIQLKGSGRTPYSRGGDGKATLSSMLREYVISIAMDKLGIRGTKSLAVVTTGEKVYREGFHNGAILTRVASSHIRVGTFEFVALKEDYNLLKEFTNYVIDRHYPTLSKDSKGYIGLFRSVMHKQIDLIVEWMRVGFIHGVMNTDNMAISGETIDYGPCAFMDIYDPGTVFSSIDRHGRYSFSNQQSIGQWNLARFAETILPLIDTNIEIAIGLINQEIGEYNRIFKEKWINMMGKKLGLQNINNRDSYLIYDLLDWMEKNRADYTKTFKLLSHKDFLNLVSGDSKDLEKWYKSLLELKPDFELMNKNNPSVIPRNHIVESVLTEASEKDNLKPLNKLLEALSDPYSDKIDDYYKNPPEFIDPNYRTFCGT